MKKHLIVSFAMLVFLFAVTVFAALTNARYSATILAPDALITDAPRAIVATAIGKVHDELRLRHFMDAQGRVRFEDGTSVDTKTTESARKNGDFIRGLMSFDDPAGNRITIRDYSSPQFGTLVVWEYAGGKDEQQISVILQQELARQGVKLK